MLRCLLIISVLIIMSSCGGKNSSSSAAKSEVPTDTSKQYRLGGVIRGLHGNIVLANGTDTLTLSADGSFSFFKSVGEGKLYDVKILSLPTNQLCELRNSKNYAYRDRLDVVVECADLLEKTASISLPPKTKLEQVRLLSNYQAKGGVGEESLNSLETKLIVYGNSLVSLRNEANQIIFLSYIGNISEDTFKVNSKTTAIALMLLEPAVISAIQDRGMLIGDAAAVLAEAVNASVQGETGKIDALSAEIDKLVNSGGNLNAPSAALVLALGRVLHSAVDILASTALTSLASSEVPATSTVINTAGILGVNFQFNKLNNSSDNLLLSASNKVARYLSLHSTGFSSVLLKPYEQLENMVLDLAAPVQKNFSVIITGPGALGNVSEANAVRVLNTSVSSGINQFFFPSVSAVLGLKNPSAFTASDCLSDASIAALSAQAAESANFKNYIANDQYYKLFAEIAYVARSRLLSVGNAARSPLEEIFSCEKFGAGVLLSSKKSIAIDNTKAIIATINSIYSATNMQSLPDLYAQKNVSFLSEAIRTGYAENEWNLSTTLKFDAVANVQRIAVGDSIAFSSVCKNPVSDQAIACEVTWDFDNGVNRVGNTLTQSFLTAGNYLVRATAVSELGAVQVQTLNINVIAKAAHIVVKNANSTLETGSLIHNFGYISVGNKSVLPLTLLNDGLDTVNILSINSSNLNFKIESSAINQLAPGTSATFNIIFDPKELGALNGSIKIVSDAPDQNNLSFNLSGNSLGHWLIKQGDTEQNFTVARSKTLYDDSEGRENLQIRLYASQDQDYPQIRLSLKGYDLSPANASQASSSETLGNGVYSLNDAAGETCLGFYADGNGIAYQYCSAAVDPLASVTVMSKDVPVQGKLAIFNFDAVNRECTSSCEKAHISGEVQYNGNF